MSNRRLTQRGYVVRKDTLPAETLRTIRDDLCVEPVNPVRDKMLQERRRWDPQAECPDESFKVYRENAAKLYLPPFYAIAKLGPPDTNELRNRGAPIDLLFHGSLRPQQTEVADKTVAHLDTHGGGLLQLRCGFGKTIIALHLFARLKVKTLVLVHKEFLMNQWKERIAQFLPEARVGTLQAKTVDVEDRDIVIGMLQSVSTGKYPPEVYAPFGMCCFDECHHLGAAVFSKAMDIGRTRYMLGLSATPDRKDGLRKVFDWQLGEVICKVEAKVTQRVEVRTLRFEDACVTQTILGKTLIQTKEGRSLQYVEKPSFRMKLLAHLVESESRMAEIMADLLEYVADDRRRILVLSERRKHLETFAKLLEEHGVAHGFYWGGAKARELEEAAEQQVVLGTYHMASEGMDIPALNTVYLASPKSDVKQSVGRILRRTDHSVVPTVVDVVDVRIPCFARQVNVRRRFYKECGFVVDGRAPAVHATDKAGSPSTTEAEGARSPATPKYMFRDR